MKACLSWLAHPVSVAGLVLLLLNDHVLKGAWPGPVTGKLSDVAGMLMFPPLLAVLLAALLPRVRAGVLAAGSVVATGLAFGLVKASEPVAGLASRAWTVVSGPSTVLADPTDLLALPVLALSWLVWRRASRGPAARRWVPVLLVPVGLFATVATTARPDPVSVTWVGEMDGKPSIGYSEAGQWMNIGVSEDGGRTFAELPRPSTGAQWSVTPSTQACAGRHCYRVVPGQLHVLESHDAGLTWATAWQITGWQYRALAADHRDVGELPANLSSHCVAVVGAEHDHVVLVANARDGVLRRDASGRWERLGAVHDRAVPLRAVPDFTGHRVMVGVLGLLAALCTGLGTLALRARVRHRLFFVLAPVAVLFDMCALFPQRASVPLWLVWGAVNVAAVVACGVVALALRRIRVVAVLAALAVAVAGFAAAGFTLEPAAPLDLYPLRAGHGVFEAAQVVGSLLPVALGIVAAALVAWLLGPPRRVKGP